MSIKYFGVSLLVLWTAVTSANSDDVNDVAAISHHLKQLEEVEQREALVLANVLANMKQTTDQLERIKHNYTEVQQRLITTYENRIANLELESLAHSEEVLNLTRSKGDLNRKYKQLEKRLTALEGRFTTQESKLSSCEQNATLLQTKIQTLEQKNEETTTHLNSTSAQLCSSIHSIETDIRIIQENMEPLKGIGFEAEIKQTLDIDSKVTSIVLSSVLFNQGSGFNSSSGYFTAPVSGTYLFWVSCTFVSLSSLHIQVLQNGQVIGSAYGVRQESSQRGVSRGMTVASLDKGDQVHFSPEGIMQHTRHAKLYPHSTYGGALLYSSRS